MKRNSQSLRQIITAVALWRFDIDARGAARLINQLLGTAEQVRSKFRNRRLSLPSYSRAARALSALCLRGLDCLSWPCVSSVALHVVESTFCCGFDSFRAHRVFNLRLSKVISGHPLAETSAFTNPVKDKRVRCFFLSAQTHNSRNVCISHEWSSQLLEAKTEVQRS